MPKKIKDLVMLDYTFLMQPTDTWQSISQFEDDFSTFLRDHNLECEVLDSINPRSGRRVLYISKKDGVVLSKQPNAESTPMNQMGKKYVSNPGRMLKYESNRGYRK